MTEDNVHDISEAKAGKDKKPKEDSQATKLIHIALQRYSFDVTPGDKVFAFKPDTPHVAMMLRGGKLGLRQNLASTYWELCQSAPSQSALTDCLTVLEGQARQKGSSSALHTRVAGDKTAIHIDMADTDNRVIEIRDGGWTLTGTAPYHFIRTELTAPMITPTAGGTMTDKLAALWRHVNVAEEDRPVLLAVMVDALIQPSTPKPVVAFLAEHGSAKSTTAKRAVSLIDPTIVPLRSAPRNIDQWIVAAAGSWLVVLDNLSTIPEWLSDALCQASTGIGDVKRLLFTNEELSVLKFRRSVILTGIDLGGLNGDLTDRLVTVELPKIADGGHHTEEDLELGWELARAKVMGGLLDLAAQVHAKLPGLETVSLPRMADFGRVLACVDEIMETAGVARYYKTSEYLMADSATSDSFIARLIELGYNTRNDSEPAGAVLLKTTPTWDMDRDWKRPPDWPKRAREVTTKLTKHAPALRSMGWRIISDEGRNHTNTAQWIINPPGTWEQR